MSRGILVEPLRVINRLVDEGLLLDYAIGGGVAALFYTEPILTYDFDVICRFPAKGKLIDPSPLFAKLKEWGYSFGVEDRIMINGVPVQFIPASRGLVEEALEKALQVKVGGINTKMLRVEYLAAIMLNLYRPKDRAKLDLLINNKAVVFNRALFHDVLTKHHLAEKWRRFNEG